MNVRSVRGVMFGVRIRKNIWVSCKGVWIEMYQHKATRTDCERTVIIVIGLYINYA